MCVTCGCGQGAETELTLHDDEHDHGRHTHLSDHGHSHEHSHGPGHSHGHTHPPFHPGNARPPAGPMVPGRDRRSIELESQVLAKNQLIAERNRGWLSGRAILALNLVSSPGAGKTTLLERTLVDLRDELKMAVIEGDQATSNDAQRILATGTRAVQINTGTGCHLEADMLERALHLLPAEPNSVLFIENVGNLVCPALFDLGERSKVVIFSVTEGEDKPLKYPHMFAAASLVLLSKTDLLPHVRFDSKRAVENALSVNPDVELLEVSAYSGVGLVSWYTWLRRNLAAQQAPRPAAAAAAQQRWQRSPLRRIRQ
jgi:hydrogenase nickel incorporation protein HypB